MLFTVKMKQTLKKSLILPMIYVTPLPRYSTVKKLTDDVSLEHVFPRSCMLEKEQALDIHNIYATTKKMNSLRSDFFFGTLHHNQDCVLEIQDNLIASTKKMFCPRECDRGLIARAILYMCNKYNYTSFGPDNNTIFHEWDLLYKPTLKEIIHGEYAFLLQGNRNPFIDHHIDNDTQSEIRRKYFKPRK